MKNRCEGTSISYFPLNYNPVTINSADRLRPECLRPYLPDIGTAGLRLRMRKNVAFMDIKGNPESYARFKDILDTQCAALLL